MKAIESNLQCNSGGILKSWSSSRKYSASAWTLSVNTCIRRAFSFSSSSVEVDARSLFEAGSSELLASSSLSASPFPFVSPNPSSPPASLLSGASTPSTSPSIKSSSTHSLPSISTASVRRAPSSCRACRNTVNGCTRKGLAASAAAAAAAASVAASPPRVALASLLAPPLRLPPPWWSLLVPLLMAPLLLLALGGGGAR